LILLVFLFSLVAHLFARLAMVPRHAVRRMSRRVPLLAVVASGVAVVAASTTAFLVTRTIGARSGITRSLPPRSVTMAAVASTEPAASPAESQALFQKLFGGSDQRPVVLYDGVCNMCNKAVDTAMARDPEGKRLRFAALQTQVGQGLLEFSGRAADDLSSMIVIRPDGVCLTRSDAALFVGKQLEASPLLRGASEVASSLLPKFLRDAAYDTVATNRYSVLGKREELRVSQDGMEDRFVPDSSAAAAA